MYRHNWRGPLYTVFNKWFLKEEDEAKNHYLAAEILKVNPLNINYFNENNFEAGTWIYLDVQKQEHIDYFKFLFPYCPTICLETGWNYIVHADDILHTYTRDNVCKYLSDVMHTVPFDEPAFLQKKLAGPISDGV